MTRTDYEIIARGVVAGCADEDNRRAFALALAYELEADEVGEEHKTFSRSEFLTACGV